MSSLNDQSISSIDLDLTWNRINLALAKSQRLLATWLPPAPASVDEKPASNKIVLSSSAPGLATTWTEDEPFQTSSEKAGFGFAPPPDLSGTASHLPSLNSTDRLRSLLLPGSKRAKSGSASSGGIVGIAGVTVATAPTPKPRDDMPAGRGASTAGLGLNEDEADDGEEVVSRSQLGRPKGMLGKRKKMEPDSAMIDMVGEAGELEAMDTAGEQETVEASVKQDDGEGMRMLHPNSQAIKHTAHSPVRRRAISYLDEVLAEREAKRKKKEQKRLEKAQGKTST